MEVETLELTLYHSGLEAKNDLNELLTKLRTIPITGDTATTRAYILGRIAN
jgi:hypothetical protein